MTVDVYLIDPDRDRSRATAAVVASRYDLRLVGAAESAEASLASLETAQPDVVLFDVADLPLRDLHQIRRIRCMCPDTRVLALAAEKTDAYLNHVAWCGADGILLRPVASGHMLRAVKEIHERGVYCDVIFAHRHMSRQRRHRRPTRRRTTLQEPVIS